MSSDAQPTCQPCSTSEHDACDGYARTWFRGYATLYACPCANAGHVIPPEVTEP